ncbi:hypothetical protein MRB53_041279 [Persea americana]|nr:hypothetical protein MRB53_041279 [Persea americana]
MTFFTVARPINFSCHSPAPRVRLLPLLDEVLAHQERHHAVPRHEHQIAVLRFFAGQVGVGGLGEVQVDDAEDAFDFGGVAVDGGGVEEVVDDRGGLRTFSISIDSRLGDWRDVTLPQRNARVRILHRWRAAIRVDAQIRLLLEVAEVHVLDLVLDAELFEDDDGFPWVGTLCESACYIGQGSVPLNGENPTMDLVRHHVRSRSKLPNAYFSFLEMGKCSTRVALRAGNAGAQHSAANSIRADTPHAVLVRTLFSFSIAKRSPCSAAGYTR